MFYIISLIIAFSLQGLEGRESSLAKRLHKKIQEKQDCRTGRGSSKPVGIEHFKQVSREESTRLDAQRAALLAHYNYTQNHRQLNTPNINDAPQESEGGNALDFELVKKEPLDTPVISPDSTVEGWGSWVVDKLTLGLFRK